MSGFNDPYYAGPAYDEYATDYCENCDDAYDPIDDRPLCPGCRKAEEEQEDAGDDL